MSTKLSSLLERLRGPAAARRFGRLRRGIEKEGLRVNQNGDIAATPHPLSLGSKLTHPHITTDYSEALLEYITPVYNRPDEALEFLADLHRFTYKHLDGEWIWPGSMPSRLNGNDSVPIADYGSSNVGTMKYVYRKGLDARYGRIMQSIAGVHYNVSVPDDLWHLLKTLDECEDMSLDDYRSARYFDLIRNFRRHSWLLLYLFGASPAVDQSFLSDDRIPEGLQPHARRTLLSPLATSLRMSDLGYQNKVQDQLKICFNSLSNYVNTLRNAISTSWPDYEAIGVREGNDWRQLNANILQIENEYYSDIRPKRVARHDETPSQALEARGVEYIEVRCLDINPFAPLGLDAVEIRFVDTFLMWCLLSESPWISDQECDHLDDNRRLVVEQGRKVGLELVDRGGRRSLSDWGQDIFAQLREVAVLLDQLEEGNPHASAIEELQPLLKDPSLTPSARLMARLQERDEDFSDAMVAMAQEQAKSLAETPLSKTRETMLAQLVETSHNQQREIEEADSSSFPEFLADYFERARQSRVLSPMRPAEAPKETGERR
ncbi:glutamate--cysteine ligase [Halomonas huangheensis]|uniref:glutamate--cysteine ligase n=1 Tax=Halomonas huangheensis TaxID=1178482 RepID=UPI0004CEF50C|nr:glutamate--cysteine ligase [Halomonas huangheensis]